MIVDIINYNAQSAEDEQNEKKENQIVNNTRLRLQMYKLLAQKSKDLPRGSMGLEN